jgi:hypothetical protein
VSPALLLTLARTEVRLRLRRISTLVTLLAVVVITWTMISDPAGGMTLLAVNEARVLYTSSTLALGSASLGGMLFSLAGFFLVRGRVGEDLRSGTGSVIAATPVGNAGFLLSRWLGAVAYLGALVLGFLLTTWACHALRGDGPIQPWVYLQTFTLVLLPTVLFTASCAVLFDSWAPLMGKGGDLVYFILWAWQLSLAMQLSRGTSGEVPGLLAFDFPGIGMSVLALEATLHTPQLALGGAPFDPSLPPLTLPAQLWTGPMALMRAATAALALLPLLPAGGLFHRFSPDRVKPSSTRVRRSPLAPGPGARCGRRLLGPPRRRPQHARPRGGPLGDDGRRGRRHPAALPAQLPRGLRPGPALHGRHCPALGNGRPGARSGRRVGHARLERTGHAARPSHGHPAHLHRPPPLRPLRGAQRHPRADARRGRVQRHCHTRLGAHVPGARRGDAGRGLRGQPRARALGGACKARLQPHFLFNILHAISTLIHRDVEAAERMMAQLSELLRQSLERGGAQEVARVRLRLRAASHASTWRW